MCGVGSVSRGEWMCGRMMDGGLVEEWLKKKKEEEEEEGVMFVGTISGCL